MPDDHSMLTAELRSLGQLLNASPRDDLADRVLTGIAAPPRSRQLRSRARSAQQRTWLRVAAVIVALLAALGGAISLSPTVRAAIENVVGLGGVQVKKGSGPPVDSSPSLPGEHGSDLREAAREVGFRPLVPAALGAPDQVRVTDGRVVSLRYDHPGGPIQIDEFAGDLGFMYDKYVGMGSAARVRVGADRGLWFGKPTTLVYVDRQGVERTQSARMTASTLVWVSGRLTLRLEGAGSRVHAITLARSLR